MRNVVKILIMLAAILSVISLQAQNRIVVSKKNFQLIVLNQKNDTLRTFPCAVGLNTGQKQAIGDKRTPEGVFSVQSIEDSSGWSHDFHDGTGVHPYAYGPYFIRLQIPRWSGIGIHGTCFPESIGARSSEGCIRLYNDHITTLLTYINIGMKVTIE